MTDLDALAALAEDAARAAADLLRSGLFGRRDRVTTKTSATDMVTDMDRASEALIVDGLSEARPDDGIVAEEGSSNVGTSGVVWVIDPLDGTTNYAHGYPCFCVSIGLEYKREIVAGVVYDPVRDEMFAAERGAGATLNGRRIQVSQTEDLNSALLCTGFPYDVRGRNDFARHFTNFIMSAQGVRRDGAAALDLAYVACGRFDGFWEEYGLSPASNADAISSNRPATSLLTSRPSNDVVILSGLRPWDVAAGVLIIQEAGGTVTANRSSQFSLTDNDCMLVASNGLIHDAMLNVLQL